MKLYQLAEVLTDNTMIYVFSMDRDGKLDWGTEVLAKNAREDQSEIWDVEPDGDAIVVTTLSKYA